MLNKKEHHVVCGVHDDVDVRVRTRVSLLLHANVADKGRSTITTNRPLRVA